MRVCSYEEYIPLKKRRQMEEQETVKRSGAVRCHFAFTSLHILALCISIVHASLMGKTHARPLDASMTLRYSSRQCQTATSQACLMPGKEQCQKIDIT